MSIKVSSTASNLDIIKIETEFSQRLPIYQRLENEGVYVLEQALDISDLKVHHIISRIKEKKSFLDKIDRKKTTNPFEDITDIVGIRLVCLFLSDINKIEEIISTNFDVITKDNKVNDTNNSNTFGYMSAHYIVKIKSEYTGLRYDSIKDTPFEVQVRTISMDAWANISHFLEYKSDNDIPPELKRDFNALSGLFYVADTHFEMFYRERQVNTQQINEDIEGIISKSNQYDDRKINLDSLSIYLKSKFPTRTHGNSNDISILVDELVTNGYNTIQVLDKNIDRGLEAFNKFESDRYSKTPFMDVGVVRILLSLIDKDIRHYLYPEDDANIYTPYEKYIND
ncbi:GTP pyrophosphokinase [Solibacillus daqui]|uniref:GTP pyrophosphokinase n=1 Tax=Solibacillus daqui TaxID=2912187 RepID=UPI002365A28A|nr:hypothetical protein [Solibacillus daqui]